MPKKEDVRQHLNFGKFAVFEINYTDNINMKNFSNLLKNLGQHYIVTAGNRSYCN